MDDLREIEPCKGFGGGCRGMDCPVCDGARVIQQLRNDSEGYVADYILDLRGRLEVAETQLQDAWRELACSDDISAVTVAGGINQLQRAREAAESAITNAPIGRKYYHPDSGDPGDWIVTPDEDAHAAGATYERVRILATSNTVQQTNGGEE